MAHTEVVGEVVVVVAVDDEDDVTVADEDDVTVAVIASVNCG